MHTCKLYQNQSDSHYLHASLCISSLNKLHPSIIRYVHNSRDLNGKLGDNATSEIVDKSQTNDPVLCIDRNPKSITEQLLSNNGGNNCKNPDTVNNTPKSASQDTFLKVEFPTLYQLAPLVSESDVLQKLLALGVDLSLLERNDIANDVLRMDFAKDIFPRLQFLKDNGINPDNFGKMINKCPHLLQHNLEEMRTVLHYLYSKKMQRDDVSYFIQRQPALLCISTVDLDSKLGCYQQVFKLSGKELRAIFHKLPRVITTASYRIRDRAYYMEKNLGFSAAEVKQMFMKAPRIFVDNQTLIANNTDYLHHVMGIPHSLIACKPQILRNSTQKLISRHRFLLYLDRAQFDPTKENYISLDAFVDPGDEAWCVGVAKASVLEYNQFMKTL